MKSREKYSESQFAWWILILVPIWLYFAIPYFQNNSEDLSQIAFYITTGIFLVVALSFYGMKTTIVDGKIKVLFGIGIIRKTIELTNISSVKSVVNKWYYGWGIRLIPNGWLYNIKGLKAVEITQNNKTSVIRIGTSEPDLLEKEISQRIKT